MIRSVDKTVSLEGIVRRVVREELNAIVAAGPTMHRSVLTPQEAADLTRRHPGSIRRALEMGELHGTQPTSGGRWRIRPECAEAWADGVECVHRRNVTPIRGTAK
jgi:excisionase family DNA binding protein